MSGFVKLYSSILRSTVWLEDSDTRIVWVTLLALADADGFVETSVPGLAHAARVPVDRCREALQKFESPDPDSQDSEHEGRRIERRTRGFLLLNYPKFRQIRDPEERRRQNREAKRRERQRKSSADMADHADIADSQHSQPRSAQAEAEAEAEEEEHTPSACDGPAGRPSDPQGEAPRPRILNLIAKLDGAWDEKEAWWAAEGPALEATAEAESKRPERLIVPWYRHYLRGEREYRGAAERERLNRLAEETRHDDFGRYDGPLKSLRGTFP